MRSPVLVLVATASAASAWVALLYGCEQRFSANPPAVASESLAPSSSTALQALLAPSIADSGAVAVDTSHAMTVTLCAVNPEPCAAPEGDASADTSYHVVFGSGRGVVRSRGQAMADLYKELRDRIASGERLDAEPRLARDGGMPMGLGGGGTTKASADSDPLTECAFHLLDLVDGVGGVTLDVVHGSGSGGCSVSLGQSIAGGVASRCLVKEPERGRRLGR